MKYYPKEWHVKEHGDNAGLMIVESPTGKIIADFDINAFHGEGKRPEEENKRNCQIAAAAGELLEFAESCENDDGRIPQTIWDIRNKAIAKARGDG